MWLLRATSIRTSKATSWLQEHCSTTLASNCAPAGPGKGRRLDIADASVGTIALSFIGGAHDGGSRWAGVPHSYRRGHRSSLQSRRRRWPENTGIYLVVPRHPSLDRCTLELPTGWLSSSNVRAAQCRQTSRKRRSKTLTVILRAASTLPAVGDPADFGRPWNTSLFFSCDERMGWAVCACRRIAARRNGLRARPGEGVTAHLSRSSRRRWAVAYLTPQQVEHSTLGV